MRRVHSSLGMRRSSSFFWSPAAHHEFERALSALNARGAEVSAAAIMTLMGIHSDLKMNDIDRHLKVPTHPHTRLTCGTRASKTVVHATAVFTNTARLLPSQKKQLVHRRVLAQLNSQTASPLDCSTGSSSQPTSPPRPSMAAVAEEPRSVEGVSTPAATVARVTLTELLDRQKQEHRQMAAMREHMLASAEGGPAVVAIGT